MNSAIQRMRGWFGKGFTNQLRIVGPQSLPGLRDVRCPPPIRITVNFHPEAGFFACVSRYESDDVA